MLLKLLLLAVAVSLVQLAQQDSPPIQPADFIKEWKLFKTTFNKSDQSPTEEIKRLGESRTLMERKRSDMFNDFYDRTWEELVQVDPGHFPAVIQSNGEALTLRDDLTSRLLCAVAVPALSFKYIDSSLLGFLSCRMRMRLITAILERLNC